MKIWSWRAAIQKADIPSTTKLVLFNLSVYMNELGQSCYPSIKQQAKDTGLTERSVTEHLRIAEKAHFIVTTKEFYKGQGWVRNTYIASYPEFTEEIPEPSSMLEPDAENTGTTFTPPLNYVPTNSSVNSPLEHSIPPIVPQTFDDAWLIYPKQRIGSKTKAKSSWDGAVKRGHTENEILNGVKSYATSDEVTRGYAKGFAAWLNDDRFLNDYSVMARSGTNPTRRTSGFDSLATASGKVQEDVEDVELRRLSKTNPALYLQRMLSKSRGEGDSTGGNHASIGFQPDVPLARLSNGKEG